MRISSWLSTFKRHPKRITPKTFQREFKDFMPVPMTKEQMQMALREQMMKQGAVMMQLFHHLHRDHAVSTYLYDEKTGKFFHLCLQEMSQDLLSPAVKRDIMEKATIS